MGNSSSQSTFIIGAGAAGLTTAYYLQKRRIPFRILESRGPGSSWARYYDHLRLHTRKSTISLPGLAMPQSVPAFPSGKQYYAYLQQYAEQFDFPIETGVEVRRAAFEKGWRLETSKGTFETDTLIVTTGIYGKPKRPYFAGEEAFEGEIVHSQQYETPEAFRGQRVLVVGAGNTGAGIAVALAETGIEIGIVVRSGIQMVPYPPNSWSTKMLAWGSRTLPDPIVNAALSQVRKDFTDIGLPTPDRPPNQIFPVVGFDLAEQVKAGKVRPHPGIASLAERTVTFEDGSEEEYDTLILATGYKPTLDFLPEITLDEWGRVRQGPPGLYTVGFHYPATEPFLLAVQREAERVAEKVARGVSSPHPTPREVLA